MQQSAAPKRRRGEVKHRETVDAIVGAVAGSLRMPEVLDDLCRLQSGEIVALDAAPAPSVGVTTSCWTDTP